MFLQTSAKEERDLELDLIGSFQNISSWLKVLMKMIMRLDW